MLPEDFSPEQQSRLAKLEEDAWAFLPPPLPPNLDLGAIANVLAEAALALGELRAVSRAAIVHDLLIPPMVRREAVLSSRIEGTQSTLWDVAIYEATGTSDRFDAPEVVRYARALDFGIERMSQLPLSLRLLRETHELLMHGTDEVHVRPGEFRKVQNFIGGSRLADARYVPPPVPEMTRALDHLEKYLHAPSDLPLLVRVGLIHYQFEAIHPFLDGNGRLGRLTISLLLSSWHLLEAPLLYLSAYFERNRAAYYDALFAVSARQAWTEWLAFFLEGVAEQARDAVDRAQSLEALREDFRRRLSQRRTSVLTLRVVDQLFATPAVSIRSVGRDLSVTPKAAGQIVERLVGAGILREITGKKRGRLFLADEILQAVDAPIFRINR